MFSLAIGLIAFLIFKFSSRELGERIVKNYDSFQISAQKYLSSGPMLYSRYAPLMLLGFKTNESKEIYQLAVNINVVHLFVISGFHISLFYLIVNKLLLLCKVKSKVAMIIPIIPIAFYLYLLGFPLSAMRAFLLTLANLINRIYLKKKYKSIDLLCVVMLMMLLYKPSQIASISFVLTFIATAAIILINEATFKSKTRKYLATCILVHLSTLPVIVALNGFAAPLGIMWGSLLAPVFIVVYTLSIFLFPFKPLMELIYKGFDFILHSIVQINPIVKFDLINFEVAKVLYLALGTYPIINKIWFLFTVTKNT